MKVLAGILILLVGVLVWAIFALRDARRDLAAQQESNEVVIVDFSNRWDAVRRSLGEQKLVNESLETNLTERARQLDDLRTEIASLADDLKRSRAETRLAQDEITKRDSQISSLEGRNVDLTQQMGDLQDAIAVLERQITEAERRLAASEGNRQELLDELRRLQNEKVELEKQLNDLAFLRDQVRKLREELTISRRLDWIRRGIYAPSTRKGAEALTDMKFGPAPTAPAGSQPSLEVELRRSGEVSINPPTNAPAARP
jgi:chromosome segregation ATPase